MTRSHTSENDVFFLDPVDGFRASYSQLKRDSELVTIGPPPHRICFDAWYCYLVCLLSAIRWNRSAELHPFATRFSETQTQPLLSLSATTGLEAELKTPLGIDWSQLRTSQARLGLLTSGTTGAPKLVWHHMETLTRGVRTGPERRADIWGMAYHPAHFAGLQVIFQAIANLNPLVRLFGLEGATIHRAIAVERISALSATPTFYRLLCTHDAPVHPLVRHVTVGGERYSAGLGELLQRVFPNARVRNIYASSEAGSLLVSDGTAFRVPKKLQQLIRIRAGRLEVHASLLADSLKSESGRFATATDEFMPTGDRVEWVCKGETFKIIGREAEQLNIGGFKVNPGEIEDAVCSYLEVAAARVYGRPNSVTGMLLCCDVVLRPPHSLTTKELRQRLSEKFPTYKVPGLVNFVESMAQTYSGKQAKQG
jgi:acyl-CoA synthetase (AMP-forming)/AMP-acid ligase II